LLIGIDARRGIFRRSKRIGHELGKYPKNALRGQGISLVCMKNPTMLATLLRSA
jgi:hypothetical protein